MRYSIPLLGVLAFACAGEEQALNDAAGSEAAPATSPGATASNTAAGQSTAPTDSTGSSPSPTTDTTTGDSVSDGTTDDEVPGSDDSTAATSPSTSDQTDAVEEMDQTTSDMSDDGALPTDGDTTSDETAATDDDSTAVADDASDDAPADDMTGDEPMDDAPPVDDSVLEDLEAYLEEDASSRSPISEQPFAEVPLTADQARQAADLLWQDMAETIRQTRQAEHDAKVITIGEHSMRYDFTIFGDKPEDGRSLFLSLHGGGNADPSVNDSQWENQKQLYQPDEGVYLAPRAPTDTWNLWHEAHIDPLFERLITNLIVLEDVNPNRVYVMGYSAGGDGVYQLGPRMADHWAAASAMAGHPNEARPFSLRNIGFTIHVGELDTDYDRNQVAQDWSDELDALEAADPGGYAHVVEIHAGKPHWMDLEDAVAVPWMAEFTRNPVPDRIVWYQDDITHQRFYWLAVEQPVGETTVTADLDGQLIQVSSDDVSDVSVRLRDDMLDLDQAVTIEFNGSEVFSGNAPRTIAVLAETLEERGDPTMMFSAEVPLNGM